MDDSLVDVVEDVSPTDTPTVRPSASEVVVVSEAAEVVVADTVTALLSSVVVAGAAVTVTSLGVVA